MHDTLAMRSTHGHFTRSLTLLPPCRYQELTPALGPAVVKLRAQRAAHPGPPAALPGMPTWLRAGAVGGLGSYNTVFADQVRVKGDLVHLVAYKAYPSLPDIVPTRAFAPRST